MVRVRRLLLRVRDVVLRSLLLLCMMLRQVVHVRRCGQADVRLCQEGVELWGRVVGLLRLMVGRVLSLRLLLRLPVAITAAGSATAPPCAARSSTPVFCYANISAGGLGERALQHVQGGDHGALLDLALVMLMCAMVVVGGCHFQRLRLQLKLELGGLRLGLSLVFTGAQSPAGSFHHRLLLADGVLLLAMGVHFMVLLVLRVRVYFVVLRVLMGVHFLVLLMLRVGVHFRMLMRGEGIHFVVLLVLAVGVHLVVRLMGLQLVAGGVG